MRINIEDIQKNMIIDEDIYSDHGNLIVGRGFSVSNLMILKNLLRQNHIEKVKVLTLSEEIIKPSIKEKIDQEIVDFKVEFHETVNSIEHEIEGIINGEIKEGTLNNLVETNVNMQKSTTLNIFQMMQKVKDSDDVTYSHCYSVSLTAYVIGKWLGLEELELKDLALSAILSDAGKASVPQDILMKKGSLNEDEILQIQKHVEYSYNMLNNYPLKNEVKEAVRYHHEREDGSGYPLGLKGVHIPFYAKIIAIADVYTALTSKRPQRGKHTPFEALKIMETQYMDKLDVTILTKFLKRIADNYIGNPVKLSNGLNGVIVFLSINQLSRPVIKLDDDETLIDLSSKEYIYVEIQEFL